jgi:hypothetical protein
MGQTDLYHHRIDTGDAPPVRMPFYRTSPILKSEIDRQTVELWNNGIISESHSD